MTRALILLVALTAAAAPVRAQTSIRALEFDDFGFTQYLAPGARASGLAGAYTAVVNDGSGLVYNPAGLAAIKRVEVTLGAGYERVNLDASFFGSRSSLDNSSGSLESFSVAFPVPVVRGSFVGAVGVFRAFSSTLDLGYRGYNPTTDTRDEFLLQQSGSVYAYHVGMGVDLAQVLSGGFSGFLLDGSISSLRQYDFTFLSSNPLRSVFVSDDVEMDVSGYGGRIGAMFHILPELRAGVNLTTPIVMKARGSGTTEITEHVDNSVDKFSRFFSPVEADYLLPFRVNAGVAATLGNILLGVDVGYSDWTAAAVDKRRLRNRELDTILREVVDVRAGAEVTLPWWPVRVRGGYARIPYPLKYLPSDRIELQEMELVTVDSERHQWAFGMGGLLGRVLMLDASWTRTSGERSLDNYSQQQRTDRFALTAGYRF